MATTKVTFTLDDETVARIEQSAARLAIPKSQVVRQAMRGFQIPPAPLTDAERKHRVRVFNELLAKIPMRPQADVDRELEEIRASRDAWGKRLDERASRYK
jgi:hypothetical protein